MTGASRARDSPHGGMGTRLLDTPSDVPSNAVRRFARGPARLPAAASGVRPRTPAARRPALQVPARLKPQLFQVEWRNKVGTSQVRGGWGLGTR